MKNFIKKVKAYLLVKKYFHLSLFWLSTVCMVGCENSGSSGNANCPAPLNDAQTHQLDASCRAADEEEHIRIEGLQLQDGQKLTLWAKTDNREEKKGIRLEVNNEDIIYTNLDDEPEQNTFRFAHDGPTAGLLCFDLHYEEGPPLHALAWQGEECNNPKEGNAGTTIFNKEDMTGNDVDSQNQYLYKIEEAASIGLIRTARALFQE